MPMRSPALLVLGLLTVDVCAFTPLPRPVRAPLAPPRTPPLAMESRLRVRQRVRGFLSKRFRRSPGTEDKSAAAQMPASQTVQDTPEPSAFPSEVEPGMVQAVQSASEGALEVAFLDDAEELAEEVAIQPNRANEKISLDEISFETRKDQSGLAPSVLDPDVCLVPGVPMVRVERAPGNARRIFTGIDIVADCEDVLEVVWGVLNDYPRLGDAVPNLVDNKVVKRLEGGGARLRQVGAAQLAPMFTFRAMTTLDAVPYPSGIPPSMEAEHLDRSTELSSDQGGDGLPLRWNVFPRPYCIGSLPHRDITMQGVRDEGDFSFYQGVWRMQPLPNCAPPGQSAMRLTYSVELSPRAWVPVALLEGQIAKTLGENLISVREYVVRPQVIRKYSIAGTARTTAAATP